MESDYEDQGDLSNLKIYKLYTGRTCTGGRDSEEPARAHAVHAARLDPLEPAPGHGLRVPRRGVLLQSPDVPAASREGHLELLELIQIAAT